MKEYDDLYRQACSELLAKAERNLIEIPAMIGRITRLIDCVLIYTEPMACALAVCDYPEWQRRGFRTGCFHILNALTVMSAVVRALNGVRQCTPEMLVGDRGRIAWLKRVLGFPIHPDDLPF